MQDITLKLVRSLKAEGVHEPEYYLVECARHDQALKVADYFGASHKDFDFISDILPRSFPISVGRLNDNKFIVLCESKHMKFYMHHDTISFRNWTVIRSQNHTEVFDLYKKLGMDT